MRVVHLLSSPVFSGPAESVLALAQAQRSLGLDVTVAVERLRPRLPYEEPAAPVFEAAGLLEAATLELSVKSSPRGLWRDVAALRRMERVSVFHAHRTHDEVLAFLAGFGRASRPRLVRSFHLGAGRRSLLVKADAWTVADARLGEALPTGRFQVLPALVGTEFAPSVDRTALRERLGLFGGPWIGLVSTFQPSRRHDVAIDAFAELHKRCPTARLLLTGDGPRSEHLRAQVSRRGLTEAVQWTGYVSRGDFPLWLSALDEVWVLGLGNDWAARVAAQARACGVRVVAVREGALGRYADALVEATPAAVAAAALGARAEKPAGASALEVAQELMQLYRGEAP